MNGMVEVGRKSQLRIVLRHQDEIVRVFAAANVGAALDRGQARDLARQCPQPIYYLVEVGAFVEREHNNVGEQCVHLPTGGMQL